jgi:hypothetical protein
MHFLHLSALMVQSVCAKHMKNSESWEKALCAPAGEKNDVYLVRNTTYLVSSSGSPPATTISVI